MTLDTPHRLPILRFLAEKQVLFAWLVFSSLIFFALVSAGDNWAASIAHIFAVSALLIAAVFFTGYCFDIVEQTALGHSDAPPISLSLARLGPRLLRMLVYLSVIASIVQMTPNALQWLVVSSALAVTPAVTAFVVFHEPLLSCLNPRRVWHFVSNMGLTYITLRLVTTSVVFLGLYVAAGELAAMQSGPGLAATSGGYVLAVLAMSRIVGALLHQRRQELGIRTHHSEEQHFEARVAERRQQIAAFLRDISRLCRAEGLKVAWPRLEEQVKRHAYRDDDLYLECIKELADRRLLYRFASGYIDRLLPEQSGAAWRELDELEKESGGKFQFHAGGIVFRLLPTAESRRQRMILLAMLESYDEVFPDHPRKKEALLKGAEQALLVDETSRARSLFERSSELPGTVDDALVAWCRRQLAAQTGV